MSKKRLKHIEPDSDEESVERDAQIEPNKIKYYGRHNLKLPRHPLP